MGWFNYIIGAGTFWGLQVAMLLELWWVVVLFLFFQWDLNFYFKSQNPREMNFPRCMAPKCVLQCGYKVGVVIYIKRSTQNTEAGELLVHSHLGYIGVQSSLSAIERLSQNKSNQLNA